MLCPVSAGVPGILKGALPIKLAQKSLNYCLGSQGMQDVAPALTAMTPAKLHRHLSESWHDSDEVSGLLWHLPKAHQQSVPAGAASCILIF